MNAMNTSFVSVIIPTRNRPQLVRQAVQSVLAQSFQALEVIVVIDGPDLATENELARVTDPRLRVIPLPTNLGPAGVRNAGVAQAQGSWIAFLDDDDQWLPQKLARQLAVAQHSRYALPIVSTRFIAKSAEGELIWPRRLPSPTESISEYLFVRNSPFMGETFVATPTLLVKKELLTQLPFNPALIRHEDFDWLVRASQLEGVGLEFVPDPMAIVNVAYTKARKSLSNHNNWKYSFDWIRSVRPLITPQVYAAFLTTVVSSQAAAQKDIPAFFSLLWEVLRSGQPRPLDLALYFTTWLIPKDLRQGLRYWLTGPRRSRKTVPAA